MHHYRGELKTRLRGVIASVEEPAALDFVAYDGELFIRSATQTGDEWRSTGRTQASATASSRCRRWTELCLGCSPIRLATMPRAAVGARRKGRTCVAVAFRGGRAGISAHRHRGGRTRRRLALEVIVDTTTFAVVERTLARFDAQGPASPFDGDETAVYQEQVLYFDQGATLRVGVPSTIFEP